MGTRKTEEDNKKPVTKTKPTEKKTPAAKKPTTKGTGKPVVRKKPAAKKTTKKAEPEKNKKQTEVQKQRPVSPVNGQPLPEGTKFTKDDERARNAGRKSGESRRQRKTFREELLEMLMITTKDSEGKEHTQQEHILAALVREAKTGNIKAYESLRDTIGEKAMEQLTVKVVAPQFSNLDAAFKDLGGDEP